MRYYDLHASDTYLPNRGGTVYVDRSSHMKIEVMHNVHSNVLTASFKIAIGLN